MNAEYSIVGCVRVTSPETLAEKTLALIDLLGGLAQFIKPGDTVFLKPNFVAPFPAAVTDFGFIAAVVQAVRACGGKPVLGESSGFEFDTAKTLQVVGAYDLAESLQVPLLDLDTGSFKSVPGPWPCGDLEIAQIVFDADVFINLPKLKHHSLTTMTGALKNLFGVLHRNTRRRLHAWNVHKGIVALNHAIHPTLTLVEGLVILSRAVYGQAQPLGVLLGGTDSVALDRLGCRLLGLDESQVAHVRQAMQDHPTMDYQVIGDEPELPDETTGKQSIGQFVHRALIQGAYVADLPYAALRGGGSLLPRLHFELGVKPFLNAERCTECGDCAEICPVDAIVLSAKRIIPQRCQCLRCLKCVSVCPENAIEVRGWQRPSSK